MFCHKCGFKLPDDAMFCSKCGTKMIAEAANGQHQQAKPTEKAQEQPKQENAPQESIDAIITTEQTNQGDTLLNQKVDDKSFRHEMAFLSILFVIVLVVVFCFAVATGEISLDDIFTTCSDCGKPIIFGDAYEMDGFYSGDNVLCEDCVNEYFFGYSIR